MKTLKTLKTTTRGLPRRALPAFRWALTATLITGVTFATFTALNSHPQTKPAGTISMSAPALKSPPANPAPNLRPEALAPAVAVAPGVTAAPAPAVTPAIKADTAPAVRPKAVTPAPAVRAPAPATTSRPKAATPAPTVRAPAPAPAVRPSAATPTPTPATVPYVAPTVTLYGSTCRETSTAWEITWNWTATGGHYVDLGSAQHRTNVVVNGGTRTWTFTTTEAGWDGSKPPAPTTGDARLSSRVAPIGHTGAMDEISITRTINEVPVHCG